MIEVKLHDIGEGMTEGEIIQYFVKPGEYVDADESLVEVQTDKMAAELPSPASGFVKEIKYDSGALVQVGDVLLILENNKEETVKVDIEKGKTEQISSEEQQPKQHNPYNRTLAVPYTRKIAKDKGISLDEVAAFIQKDTVREEDIHAFINDRKGQNRVLEQKEYSCDTKGRQEQPQPLEEDVLPFKGIRKQIAKNMTRSLYTIPHVTHFDEVDMSKLVRLREELKQEGVFISAAAFFVKALVIALKEFPIFNAELNEETEEIYLKKSYHVGLATDTKQGLIVPVLKSADKKSIREIHQEMKSLSEKVQKGKLSIAEMKGSTVTISNVGPIGSVGATPIINYPETALISFHKMKKRAVVTEEDEIAVRPVMNISMSFDHRVADGGTAVAFTNDLIAMLENPQSLWLNLV